jgi:short-subunit dehydrogenase
MIISNQVVLVTGANRGLGREIAKELVAKGAKVYAAARNIASIDYQGVIPIQLDITNEESINKAFEKIQDLTILVNNAGISKGTSFLAGDIDDIKEELNTNFFGTLAVSREAITIFKKNNQGFILNILSALSWLSVAGATTYAASKAAEWSLTNGLRLELSTENIKVSGLHVAFMDTDLTKGLSIPKESPEDVAKCAVKGLEEEKLEIIADQVSAQVQKGLAGGVEELYS